MNIAIILSGGTGTRMGLSIPKQYVEVNGIPVIQYCLKTLLGHKMVDMAVIAVADEWQDFVQQCVDRLSPKIPVYYSQPGDTRQGSIINALKVTKQKGAKDNDIVLIHDAARPLVSADIISDTLKAMETYDAVDVAIPAVDTIVQCDAAGSVMESIQDRNLLWHMQTPQGFRQKTIQEAYHIALKDPNFTATDDCGTVLRYLPQVKVGIVRGIQRNIKLTYADDLSLLEFLLSHPER